MNQKQLWMLVGGDGAGKSTFYELALKPLGMPFINADLIVKEVYPDDPEGKSYLVAKHAESLRTEQLLAGKSFCFETVFSHPSKVDFIAQAKALGYEIIIVVIHLDDSELNKVRVSQRVIDGGHSVPEEKIQNRIPRTLKNIGRAIPLCDQVWVLDNSSLDTPFAHVFTLNQGRITAHKNPLPGWAADFVTWGQSTFLQKA